MIFWTFLGASVSVNIGRSIMTLFKVSIYINSKITNIKDDALEVSTLKI